MLPFTDGPFDTSGATTETGEPGSFCGAFGHTVWYEFTAIGAHQLFVDTIGSDYNTFVVVYLSNQFPQPFACNPSSVGGGGTQTYYFQVGGVGGDSGNLVFHLSGPTPTPTVTRTITPTPTRTFTPTPTVSSFTGETTILTPKGLQRIDSLRVGSTLLSYDHETGTLVPTRISKLASREVDSYLNVTTSDGTQIKTTQRHPFYDPVSGTYRTIRSFSPGERLATVSAHGLSEVTVVSIESVQERVTVYNLHVENENHNYVAAGLLVHNKTPTVTHTPTATATAAATATATATDTPLPATATATPAPGLHDGRAKKISAAGSVVLTDGDGDVKNVVVQVRNEGDHEESFAVYVDIVPPGGITNPYGCAPIGRIIDAVVTLGTTQQTEQTVVSTTQTFDCTDVQGALNQTYTIKAAVDVHADDAGACAEFLIQSMACFSALGDDDSDPADNRATTNAFKVK